MISTLTMCQSLIKCSNMHSAKQRRACPRVTWIASRLETITNETEIWTRCYIVSGVSLLGSVAALVNNKVFVHRHRVYVLAGVLQPTSSQCVQHVFWLWCYCNCSCALQCKHSLPCMSIVLALAETCWHTWPLAWLCNIWSHTYHMQ